MNRAGMGGVFALCVGLTVGCGGGAGETAQIAEKDPTVAGDKDRGTVAVSETGCLTASGDRFVLTNLERTGDAAATTESYQLVGDAGELRKLVGRQVRVSGEADPPKVAEVREVSPAAPAGTSGQEPPPAGAQPDQPQVSTTQETRLEVTQLHVRSIEQTADACTAPAATGAPR